MMRDCAVLVIEGTHASGKTTLTHALAARYRERGIHVATVEEPARHSPFIEKIVEHGRGRFDLETDADLFGRQHTMIICSKTIANVLATPGSSCRPRQAAVLAAMEALCRAWAPSTTSSSTAVTTTPRNKSAPPAAPKSWTWTWSWTCNLPPTASPSSWRH
jgi:Thymidylate kinase